MHKTVADWQEFTGAWAGPRNFRMTDDLVSFEFAFPPLEQIVDELRSDADASIKSGLKSSKLDLEQRSPETFRQLPIEQVMEGPFALAHFDLARFDAPGRFLHGFGEKVLNRWERVLADAGFTWERCYPIIFISGKASATNYHMDFSHVMAWQIYGTKRFCGLKDPDRWADSSTRINYKPGHLEKPVQVREDDSLCYDMRPNDKLWNVLLTPHWVEAGEEPAMSINISHGGLRHNGRLSPNEEELEQARAAAPHRVEPKLQRRYA
jgi:hypothetical protein